MFKNNSANEFPHFRFTTCWWIAIATSQPSETTDEARHLTGFDCTDLSTTQTMVSLLNHGTCEKKNQSTVTFNHTGSDTPNTSLRDKKVQTMLREL